MPMKNCLDQHGLQMNNLNQKPTSQSFQPIVMTPPQILCPPYYMPQDVCRTNLDSSFPPVPAPMIFIVMPPNYIVPSMLNQQPTNCSVKQINQKSVAVKADGKKVCNSLESNIQTVNTSLSGQNNTAKPTIGNNVNKESEEFIIPPQYSPSNVTNCTYCGVAAQTYHCSDQFPICKNCIKLVEQAMYIPQVLPSQACHNQIQNRIPEISKGFNPINNNSCSNVSKVPIQPLHSPTNATSISGKVAIPPTPKLIKKNDKDVQIDTTTLLEKRKNIVWCSTCNKREALCTKDRQYKTCLQCCRKKRNRYRKRKREYSDLAYI